VGQGQIGDDDAKQAAPSPHDELIAVEPEPYLRGQAEQVAAEAAVTVRVTPGTAAELGLAPGSADAVVVSGVLCSVPNPGAALAEFRRVLRPGGELRFYEHVRSRRGGFARWQRGVDPIWSRLMGGCRTHRDTVAAIEAAGFRVEWCRGFGFPPGARLYPVMPRVLGIARTPAGERA
jgi:ubiquinone/menaquinone biosynthesis C-methylase UbiE